MRLEFESLLNRPVEEVFQFCASKEGFLAHFPFKTTWIRGNETWTHVREELEFTFSIAGFPIHYLAEITEFDKNRKFVDVMKKGPYQFFQHEHHFEAEGSKTRYRDVLDFSYGLKGSLDKLIAGPMTKNTFKKRHFLLNRCLVAS